MIPLMINLMFWFFSAIALITGFLAFIWIAAEFLRLIAMALPRRKDLK